MDQVTTYTYGTTLSGSQLASNNLLHTVTYPDSGVVTTEYNALGQVISREDPAGNIVETAYDAGGRELHRMASTIAGGFDTTVQRVTMAYTDRGQVLTVTQYDDDSPTAGSILDQVKYTYDDWGPVSLLNAPVARSSTICVCKQRSCVCMRARIGALLRLWYALPGA